MGSIRVKMGSNRVTLVPKGIPFAMFTIVLAISVKTCLASREGAYSGVGGNSGVGVNSALQCVGVGVNSAGYSAVGLGLPHPSARMSPVRPAQGRRTGGR